MLITYKAGRERETFFHFFTLQSIILKEFCDDKSVRLGRSEVQSNEIHGD